MVDQYRNSSHTHTNARAHWDGRGLALPFSSVQAIFLRLRCVRRGRRRRQRSLRRICCTTRGPTGFSPALRAAPEQWCAGYSASDGSCSPARTSGRRPAAVQLHRWSVSPGSESALAMCAPAESAPHRTSQCHVTSRAASNMYRMPGGTPRRRPRGKPVVTAALRLYVPPTKCACRRLPAAYWSRHGATGGAPAVVSYYWDHADRWALSRRCVPVEQ